MASASAPAWLSGPAGPTGAGKPGRRAKCIEAPSNSPPPQRMPMPSAKLRAETRSASAIRHDGSYPLCSPVDGPGTPCLHEKPVVSCMVSLRTILDRWRRPPAGARPEPATDADMAVVSWVTHPPGDASESHPRGAGTARLPGLRRVSGRSGAVPLVALAPEQAARLVGVDAGRRVQRRLLALGLTPGTRLWLVSNVGGPAIVAVRTTRLALGREIARRIWVVPEVDGP